MPNSVPEGKLLFEDWLAAMEDTMGEQPAILDIGPGAGAYARIIQRRLPDAEITAVEWFKPYVERFGLMNLYGEIIIAEAGAWARTTQRQFDVAILGDVLEHLPDREARDLLRNARRISRFVFASVPYSDPDRPWVHGWQQTPNEYKENPRERHMKEWTRGELLELSPLSIVFFPVVCVMIFEGEKKMQRESSEPEDFQPEDIIRNNINNIPGCSDFAEDVTKHIWIVDAFLNTPEKIAFTEELIRRLQSYGEDIALISHTPVPARLQALVAYCIYDVRNTLIRDWQTTLWYSSADLKIQYKSGSPYQGFAIYLNRKNALKLLAGRYDDATFVEYDIDLDALDEYQQKGFYRRPDAETVAVARHYLADGKPRGMLTDLYTVHINSANECLPDVSTWEEFKALGKDRLFEVLMYDRLIAPWEYGSSGTTKKVEFVEIRKAKNKVYSDSDFHIIFADELNGGVMVFLFNRSEAPRSYELFGGFGPILLERGTVAPNCVSWHWLHLFHCSGGYVLANDRKYPITNEPHTAKFWMRGDYVSPYWDKTAKYAFEEE
jgi:hypothetical protein